MTNQHGEHERPDLAPELSYEPEVVILERIYNDDTKLVVTAHMNEDGTLEYFTYDCYIHKYYNEDTGVTRWDGRQGGDSLEYSLIAYCNFHNSDIESYAQELVSVFDEIRRNEEEVRLFQAK